MSKKALAAVMVEKEKIELQEFEIPKIRSDDALLRVEAVGICGSDYGQYYGKLKAFGIDFPVIPGHENLGYIEEIGDKAAKQWGVKEGDRVIIEGLIPCHYCQNCLAGNYRICSNSMGYGTFLSSTVPPYLWGGYSQYMYLHPNTIVHKIAEKVRAEEAVLFVAIANGIRWAQQVPKTGIGDTVVILGPGQQGLGCVIGAKEAGAFPVIIAGLTQDKKRLEVAKTFGADHVIDVQQEDLVERVRDITEGSMADIVIEAAGSLEAQSLMLDLVRAGGTVILAGVTGAKPIPNMIGDRIVHKEIKIQGVMTHDFRAVIPAIRLIESGKYPLAKMSTHTFSLERADIAIRTVGREVSGEEPIHVTIVP